MKLKKMNAVIMTTMGLFFIITHAYGENRMANKKNHIQFAILTGEAAVSKTAEQISEKEISLVQLAHAKENGTLPSQIEKLFENRIKNVQIESSGNYQDSDTPGEKSNWLINGFLISLSLERPQEKSSEKRGTINLLDLNNNNRHSKTFLLDSEAACYAFIRKKQKILVIAMNMVENKEPVQGTETIYHTEYRAGKFIIYSADENWSGESLKTNEILFNRAKAVIHTDNGDMVLKGETILFVKKDDLLIAKKACLIDQKGKTHGDGSKITVKIDEKLDFKVE